MHENARTWLTRGDRTVTLNPHFLMLLGNPHLFQKAALDGILTDPRSAGVFGSGCIDGRPISYCEPLFGAPAVAMYLEVAAALGARRIIACGYVGGLDADMEIGSYVLPDSACALDGCTRAYVPSASSDTRFHADPGLIANLEVRLEQRCAAFRIAPIVSIDALLLEDDAMIARLTANGLRSVDLETACLYALGERLGLPVAALHIVSDNPVRKVIDPERHHEAAFREQLLVAAAAFGIE
jgi:uridine phosphorylase